MRSIGMREYSIIGFWNFEYSSRDVTLVKPLRARAVDLVEGGDVVVNGHPPVADRGLGAVLDVAAGVGQAGFDHYLVGTKSNGRSNGPSRSGER